MDNDTLKEEMSSAEDAGLQSILGSHWKSNVQAYHAIMEEYSDVVVASKQGIGSWFFEYSFVCQPVDYSDRPAAMRMVNAAWWFYFSKFIDWFDTLFFVMRKKFQHLSLLHLVHHGLMPFSIWFGVKFCGGGQSTFFGLLNTQVHVVMYLYYSLAALGPKYQKYLWWKRYLTTIQMVQFLLVLLHALQLLFVDCNYPKVFVYAIITHAILFIGLFTDFYIKTYVKRKDGKKKEVQSAKSDCKNEEVTKMMMMNNEGLRKRANMGSVNGMCIQQAYYDNN
ncbi:unnamed protein product [Notodromas monacha]|uniref:Elongation of very long chain fatty acids protein n=1 Tax=Notodromas monacha TaxID=399045 RepID=A0A7R9BV95_9CRUS|nr:unnamed protein product [Notodromas monacha]CAG0922375.1 unnamed protein product [Notodromas monacha]